MAWDFGNSNADTYDSRAEAIKRQLAYADALRKQGMELPTEGKTVHGGAGPLGALPDIYVPPSFADYAAPVIQSGIGGYFANQAEQSQAANEAQAQKEYEDWVSSMPGAQPPSGSVLPQTTGQQPTQPPAAPNTSELSLFPLTKGAVPTPTALPEGATALNPTPVQATLPATPIQAPTASENIWGAPEAPPPPMVDPLAENQAKMQWAARGMTNPLSKTLALEAWKKGIEFPEKMATLAEQSKARKDLQAQVASSQLDRLQLQLASVDKNSAEGRQLRREEAQLKKQIAEYTADHKAPPRDRLSIQKDASGKYVLMNMDAIQRGEPGVVDTKTIAPPSAEEAKRIAETRSTTDKIDDAIGLLEANPDSMGWAKGTAGSFAFTSAILNAVDPGGIQTRAAAANIGSAVIKDRSGATVTMWESPRLRPFVPFPEDSAPVAAEKLKALRRTMQQEGYSFVRDAEKGAGGEYEDINPGLTPAEQEELQRLKAKHGR